MVPEDLPKRVPAGPWKPMENRFRNSFSIGGASRRAGAEKTLATLRSEPSRTSIYGVLSNRTSLSDFSLWLQKPWKRRLLSYPLAPQTHACSMKVEKKEVWENNGESLKIASAKKQKSDPKMWQNRGPNPGQIQGWKPSCPRGAPDPEKTPKSRPKSWKKDPRTTNSLGRKSAGNRHGFCFLNIYSSDFLSRREARCDSKPACKGNLSCQSYLCSASGFAAVDHDDKSTQLSNKLEGTKAHRLNDCPNTCERDFFLQSAWRLPQTISSALKCTRQH